MGATIVPACPHPVTIVEEHAPKDVLLSKKTLLTLLQRTSFMEGVKTQVSKSSISPRMTHGTATKSTHPIPPLVLSMQTRGCLEGQITPLPYYLCIYIFYLSNASDTTLKTSFSSPSISKVTLPLITTEKILPTSPFSVTDLSYVSDRKHTTSSKLDD